MQKTRSRRPFRVDFHRNLHYVRRFVLSRFNKVAQSPLRLGTTPKSLGEMSERAEVVAWVQVDADHLACPEWNLHPYHDVLAVFPRPPHVWNFHPTQLACFTSGAIHSSGYYRRAPSDSGTQAQGSYTRSRKELDRSNALMEQYFG